MILTENQPLLGGRDLRVLVPLATIVEGIAFDAVMVSEQTCSPRSAPSPRRPAGSASWPAR
jgi:hypothetical protein